MRAFRISSADLERCPDRSMVVAHWREDGTCLHETNVDRVWKRMDANERYGVRFGLFPSWVESYDLTTADHVELMGKT